MISQKLPISLSTVDVHQSIPEGIDACLHRAWHPQRVVYMLPEDPWVSTPLPRYFFPPSSLRDHCCSWFSDRSFNYFLDDGQTICQSHFLHYPYSNSRSPVGMAATGNLLALQAHALIVRRETSIRSGKRQ